MEKHLIAGRYFQLWHYTVSHGHLLIRSPMDNDHQTNIDIWFRGVQYLELPRLLGEIEIEEPVASERMHLEERLHASFDNSSVTVVRSGKNRYFIVSVDIEIEANHLNITEPPYKAAF